MSGKPPTPKDPDPREDEQDGAASSLIDMMMRQARANLDEIQEPSSADLEAIDGLDGLSSPLDASIDLQPALSLLAEIEEPELVSLEGLDDIEDSAVSGEDLDDVDELLEDVETLIEDHIDIDLDDDDLDDEGYDLDDEDIDNYQDLYGDDGTIIPSFREGEFAEEEESDTAYYDDLR